MAAQGKGNVYDLMGKAAEQSRPGANGVLFAPYMSGERCPYPDPNARGVFYGLSLSSTRGDITRAVMEGVTYSLRQLVDLMNSFVSIEKVYTSGGGSVSPLWRQMQADIFDLPVYTMSASGEGGAYGAILVAGVGAGVWGSLEEAASIIQVETETLPIREITRRPIRTPTPSTASCTARSSPSTTRARRWLCKSSNAFRADGRLARRRPACIQGGKHAQIALRAHRALPAARRLRRGETANELTAVFFDVGKADAILLYNGEMAVLIDAGENGDGKDVAEAIRARGIERLDLLIITHFDKDHVGGADKILENIEVARVLEPDYDKDSKQYRQYREALEEQGVAAEALCENHVLHPRRLQIFPSTWPMRMTTARTKKTTSPSSCASPTGTRASSLPATPRTPALPNCSTKETLRATCSKCPTTAATPT